MSTGFSFGFKSPTTSATVAPTLNLGSTFKSPSTAGGITLPTSSNTGSLSFTPSNTNVTSAVPTLNFATTSTPSLQLGTSTGFNFGTNVTSSNVTNTQGVSVIPQTSVATTTNVGLGGIPSTNVATTTTATLAQKETTPKDQPLPNEIQQTVESLKSFIKTEKTHSSDISRCSVKEYKKISDDIEMLINSLKDIENKLQKNRSITETLKYDTAKGLQYIEMAQRTQDTPPGLQYENIAPMQFFMELVDSFEKEMHTLKIQLEAVEKWMKSSHGASNISSEDISLGMKRLHETFVALAGHFQTVHGEVENQKEQFLNLRKIILNDPTNIFENTSKKHEMDLGIHDYSKNTMSPMSAGPTPFSTLGKTQAHLFTQTTTPGIVMGNPIQDSFSKNLSFGMSDQTFHSASQSAFQLNKPPTGNKRGKM